MPPFLSRLTLSTAILAVSVLVHLGVFGVLVLTERFGLRTSGMQTIDVELVKPDEIPEPPKQEPPKPDLKKPEPPKAEPQKLPSPAPSASAPTSPASSPSQAPPLPPPPVPMSSAGSPNPQQLESKSAKAEPQAPPDASERSNKPLAPGGPPSDSKSKLTPEDIAALRAQIQKCWQLPVGIPGVLGLELIIRVSFGPKGQLLGDPVILQAPASERGPLLAGIALKALDGCAPYRMPAGKYNDWKVLDLRFLATGMTGLGTAKKLPQGAQ